MTMGQVTFTDPKTGTAYPWPNNPPYDGPAPAGKQRNIQRTSNTGNVGATKQQGDDGPYIINWNVAVYTRAHVVAMWVWYNLSKLQTIYLTDWEGSQFEGQIIDLQEQWVGAMAGPGDTKPRLGYTKMVFQFEVYRFISGPLFDAGVAA